MIGALCAGLAILAVCAAFAATIFYLDFKTTAQPGKYASAVMRWLEKHGRPPLPLTAANVMKSGAFLLIFGLLGALFINLANPTLLSEQVTFLGNFCLAFAGIGGNLMAAAALFKSQFAHGPGLAASNGGGATTQGGLSPAAATQTPSQAAAPEQPPQSEATEGPRVLTPTSGEEAASPPPTLGLPEKSTSPSPDSSKT